MNAYIVVHFEHSKSEDGGVVLDFPKDFPIPNVGDSIIMRDPKSDIEHRGIVHLKMFIMRETYRELAILTK